MVLWQCQKCLRVVWADPDAEPRCPGCESYQTLKVKTNTGQRTPGLEWEF